MSSDNQRVEQTIEDAFQSTLVERFDNNARVNDFSFLPETFYVKIDNYRSDTEIVSAVQPLLPKLESLRKELSKNGSEK